MPVPAPAPRDAVDAGARLTARDLVESFGIAVALGLLVFGLVTLALSPPLAG